MIYLESLDGMQSYRADMFCRRNDLIDGQIYTLDEIGFVDWLKTSSAHKPPQKKLRAVNY